MEREHLIIIVLILVALYMTNSDDSKTVCAWGPLGRIRYSDCPSPMDCNRAESFALPGMPERIRYSDKHFAHSQHIKNHIRNRNRNSMFNGMMAGEISGDSSGQGYE